MYYATIKHLHYGFLNEAARTKDLARVVASDVETTTTSKLQGIIYKIVDERCEMVEYIAEVNVDDDIVKARRRLAGYINREIKKRSIDCKIKQGIQYGYYGNICR